MIGIFLSAIVSALPAPTEAAVAPNEVVVDHGARPTRVWRTFAGACGPDGYEISIWPGRRLSGSVRSLRIDGVSLTPQLRSAMSAWKSVAGEAIDVVIAKCEEGRAQIRFDVSEPSNRRTLHFYYLWLSGNGRISVVGEK